MKSRLFTLLFLIAVTASFGQVRKGSTMITGSFNYNRNADPGFQFVSIGQTIIDQTNAYASVGSLLGPRFAIGLDLNVNYRFFELDQSSFTGGTFRHVETSSVVTPGIFVRNYFPLSEKFAAFVEGGYGLGFGNTHTTNYATGASGPSGSSDGTSKTNTIRLTAGLNYFITNRFALECSPGVITWSMKNPNYGESTSGVNTAIGLKNLTFGFVFFLGGTE